MPVNHLAPPSANALTSMGMQGIDIATKPLQRNYAASQQMMKDRGVQPPSMLNKDFNTRRGKKRGYAEGGPVNLRPDGTPKGQGWMGVMKTPSGGDVTELSVGVNLNGEETLIPLVVPTLDELEVKYLLENAEGLNLREGIGRNILLKAQQHAAGMMKDGKSPFADAPEYAEGGPVKKEVYK
jgi:hypothetical protein